MAFTLTTRESRAKNLLLCSNFFFFCAVIQDYSSSSFTFETENKQILLVGLAGSLPFHSNFWQQAKTRDCSNSSLGQTFTDLGVNSVSSHLANKEGKRNAAKDTDPFLYPLIKSFTLYITIGTDDNLRSSKGLF